MNRAFPCAMFGCLAVAMVGSFAAGQTDDRKSLADPDPQIRLKIAVPLARQLDEQAVGVLIELLGELQGGDRRLAESTLRQLAEKWAPDPGLAGDDDVSRRIRRDCWSAWWKNTDGPALLAVFRKRTLSPEQATKLQALIVQLGDTVYAKREHASSELVSLGPAAVPMLRQAMQGADLEQLRRLEQCIKHIETNAKDDTLPPVAARLLAVRKPAGATEALLAFLPFTEDQIMQWEVSKALQRLAVQNGKPDPALVKALEDQAPVRRAVAGEVLAGLDAPKLRSAVRKLLTDPDATVRLRVAVALTCAADKEAVPVLIGLLAELPGGERWRAEEILQNLAGATAPQMEPAEDAASRTKYQAGWKTWWKDHAATTKLTAMPVPPPLLDFTVIAAIPENNSLNSRVLEVDRNAKVRWQFDGVHYPVDVHVLPGDRVLIAEMGALRITERDFQGHILWQKNDLPAQPCNVQRLANGNTFVCTQAGLIEFDAAGNTVLDLKINQPYSAWKTSDGQMIYQTGDGACVRLDAAGKEVKRFVSGLDVKIGGWIELTPKGRILADHLSQIGVGEFDLEGKRLWQAPVTVASTAVRNGHVIAGDWSAATVSEIDRAGKVVWQYQLPSGYKPWRARKR